MRKISFYNRHPYLTRSLFVPLFLLVLHALLTTSVLAQDDDQFDPNAAPPPVKALSKTERSQLDSQADIKDHTKLALELMDARLVKAEALNQKGDFTSMYTELGGFHAIMDNTLDYLLENSRGRNKDLSMFKRFEIGLRAFAPRLGLIRRETPSEYDHYLRSLLRYIRDARSKAIEPLFGNSVVPNMRPEEKPH